MSSVKDHIQQASHNQEVLENLLKQDPVPFDWVTTVGFYKSVHLIEAIFAEDSGKHSASHDDRRKELTGNNRYKQIYRNYGPLYRAARVARYLAIGDVMYSGYAQYKLPEQVISELLNDNLQQVERSVLRRENIRVLNLKNFSRIEFKDLPLVNDSTPTVPT